MRSSVRSLLALVGVGLSLTACPRVAVNFSTDPSIMRGAWTGTIKQVCSVKLTKLAWSPDGTRFATILTSDNAGKTSTNLVLWNASNVTKQRSIPLIENYYGQSELRWNSDGSSLSVVSRTWTGTRVESFDASSGAKLGVRELPVNAWTPKYALSRDLSKLATVIALPTTASSLQPQLTPPPPNLALVVWNLQTGLEERRVSLGASQYAEDFAFSPDGSSIAVAINMAVKLFGPDQSAHTLSLPGDGTAYWLAWNTDGSQLNAAGPSGVRTWRVSDGSVLRDVNLGTNGFYRAAFNQDANRVAFNRQRNQVEVWNLETASKVFSRNLDEADIMNFSPNSMQLAVGSPYRCDVPILDASSGSTASTITLEPLEPDRSISLNLTASFVDENSYAIAGTTTIQNEPVYTVQGTGWVGYSEYLVPSAAPTPRLTELTLRDANGATPWGTVGFQWVGNYAGSSRYDGWWSKPDGKQYTVLMQNTQP